jgi:hypothetical protein
LIKTHESQKKQKREKSSLYFTYIIAPRCYLVCSA